MKLEAYKRQKVAESCIAWKGNRLGTALFAEHLKATTHRVVVLSDGWRCAACRSFTTKANLEAWCTTPCLGVLSEVKGTRIGRGVVHYTHNIRQTRGVLWCKCCGFFSVKRCDNLAKKCRCVGLVRRPTPAGKELIRRMSIGEPPPGYKEWPDTSHEADLCIRTWLGCGIWAKGDVGPQV